jgi:hypothetical protein
MKFGLLIPALLAAAPLGANDGAAEVAVGGLRLRQEGRVRMLKERLFISERLVRVDYEFLNESRGEVVTEIAFPIPDHQESPAAPTWTFQDFTVTVDGAKVACLMDAKALLGEKDVSSRLRSLGIDIPGFGGWTWSRPSGRKGYQVDALSADAKARLVREGLVADPDEYETSLMPLWTVRKTFHWTQRFPAGQVVKISHSYQPAKGVQALSDPMGAFDAKAFPDLCADDSFRRAVAKAKAAQLPPGQYQGAVLTWVKYILTTANTWKGPIGDFELEVNRAMPAQDSREGPALLTFCWDGKVEKSGPDTFRVRARDFRPSRELIVYFLRP